MQTKQAELRIASGCSHDMVQSYLNICSPWNAAIMKRCDVRTSGRDGQLVAALHPGVVDSVSGVKQVKAENCVGPVLILTVQCGV